MKPGEFPMSIRKLLTAMTLLALLPVAALAADISGNWTASFDTQIGPQQYAYTFVVKDGKLTGKAKNATSEADILEGTVDGDVVSFVENFNYQGQVIKITYTGKVVSGDEIHFTRDVMGMVKEEVVAKRAK
jgi:hypothetical protein